VPRAAMSCKNVFVLRCGVWTSVTLVGRRVHPEGDGELELKDK